MSLYRFVGSASTAASSYNRKSYGGICLHFFATVEIRNKRERERYVASLTSDLCKWISTFSRVQQSGRESLKRPLFVQDSSYVTGVTVAQKRCDPRYVHSISSLPSGPLRYFFHFSTRLSATKADIILRNNLYYERGIGYFRKLTEKYFRNESS